MKVKVEGNYPSFYINGRKVLFQEVERLKADAIENIEGRNPLKGNVPGMADFKNGWILIQTKK